MLHNLMRNRMYAHVVQDALRRCYCRLRGCVNCGWTNLRWTLTENVLAFFSLCSDSGPTARPVRLEAVFASPLASPFSQRSLQDEQDAAGLCAWPLVRGPDKLVHNPIPVVD